ncbi:MAG: DUF2130 domain-containing protein [Clostridia bacterium]|nr:DUF2130 domain-containing protein [Clostridia bacterium]
MVNITCPHCGENFGVNASEYQSVAEQIRVQVEDHIRQEAVARKDEEIQAAVAIALEKARTSFRTLEKQVIQEKADNEKSVTELKHLLEKAEQDKNLAVQKAVAERDAENARLSEELKHSKEEAGMNLKDADERAETRIRELEAKHLQDTTRIKAAADAEIAKWERQIAAMTEKAKAADTEKELAVRAAKDEALTAARKKDAEIVRLQGQLQTQEQAAKVKEASLKEQYETALRLKEDEFERVKDFHARKSTKAIGESLEVYCQNQFNAIRTVAFPGAYFEKDNDARSGSKGDFIFRDEALSIMFEMKTELDETTSKRKNEDFFKELDKDRKEKGCEFAVLVSTLEADSDLYNAGIVDVSFRFPKMYVVRPTQFITIISLLRNAALNSLGYQKELALIKGQQLDLTNFEKNMQDFKDSFGKNYRIASEKLKSAVEGIDRTIATLQRTKENLLASDTQLRLANGKADDLSIKKLTKNAPSVAAKLSEIKNAAEPKPEKI